LNSSVTAEVTENVDVFASNVPTEICFFHDPDVLLYSNVIPFSICVNG